MNTCEYFYRRMHGYDKHVNIDTHVHRMHVYHTLIQAIDTCIILHIVKSYIYTRIITFRYKLD